MSNVAHAAFNPVANAVQTIKAKVDPVAKVAVAKAASIGGVVRKVAHFPFWVMDHALSETEQVYKVGKVVVGVVMELDLAGVANAPLRASAKAFGVFNSFVGARHIIPRTVEFALLILRDPRSALHGKTFWKIGSRAAFGVANICETFSWIHWLDPEGKTARFASLSTLFGGTKVFGAFGDLPFSDLKRGPTFVCSLMSIVDAGITLGKPIPVHKPNAHFKAYCTFGAEFFKQVLNCGAPKLSRLGRPGLAIIGFSIVAYASCSIAKFVSDAYIRERPLG